MLEKCINLIKVSNEGSGFISLISLFITVLTLVFASKVIWVIFLVIIASLGLWYFFNEHIKNNNRIVVGSIALISIIILLGLWVQRYYFSDPAIFSFTQWFNLIFEDNFVWGNLSEDQNFRWWNKDDSITNSLNQWITLKTNSAISQVYPIFQDLRKINRDYILLSEFYLPEGARVSTQFMNTQGVDSNLYLWFHYQECVLNAFQWTTIKDENYNKWYGSYLYERWPIWPPDFNKKEVSSGNYFMLVSITNNIFSCYIQKEGESNYTTVTKDRTLKYSNLWGPALSRIADGISSFPKILNFKLYLRK